MARVPEVLVGPMLRFIGETEATVWVEIDEPCEVEVLGHKGTTFTVEDHHFALVVIEGLEAGVSQEYEVHVAGECVWPPEGYEFPHPRIRTIPKGGDLRLLFGSCRTSAPHHPPHTSQRWWNPMGRGIDALHTFALRMLRQPQALWPDALMMMGDQLYADQPPKNVREKVAGREVHEDGPVDVLEDFEEYTVGYRDVWTYPVVRWMLSTLPSSMIFDDHEINDKWKTSQAWLDEMRQTDWYEGRVIGGLMAYWVFQHLGNLSPRELADDETFQELQKVDDGSELVRELAERAESQDGPLPVQLLQRSRPGPAGDARLPRRPPARGRQAADHERGRVGVGQGPRRRRARPPADGQLAAVPAARRHARHRGLVGVGHQRRLGQAARPARREGQDRRQPRPLGVLPAVLPRDGAARDRRRDRRLRGRARHDDHVRRRRPSLLRHRGDAAGGRRRRRRRRSGTRSAPACARSCRPASASSSPSVTRGSPRRSGGRSRRRRASGPGASAPGSPRGRASATRSAPSRSPAARSASGSSRSRAAGANRSSEQ